MDPRYAVLDDAARLAHEFVDSLATRQVGAQEGLEELRERFSRPLTDGGEDPRTVIADLARDADPGLIASGGPRYFGFVIGGSLPVAIAADWLTGAWDQNGGGFVASPALSVVEEVAGAAARGGAGRGPGRRRRRGGVCGSAAGGGGAALPGGGPGGRAARGGAGGGGGAAGRAAGGGGGGGGGGGPRPGGGRWVRG